MTNDIERHSPDEWRKTAAALMSESVAVGAGETTAKVNANGAPLLGDSRDLFRPKTSDIPAKPGVYKWRDGEGRVIYVGKAKNLRNRLTNYFQPLYLLHPRTQTMVLTARSLEWTVVATELESLTLEYTWIKEFDPRFNVQFRDDKTYPYLAVSTGERIPRVWVTRSRKRRDTRYFGPYAKVWELRHSLDRLLRTFPVRTCTTNVFHKAQLTGRPCLFASIGKCSAPCVNRIEADEHRRLCEQLVGVMTGRLGRPRKPPDCATRSKCWKPWCNRTPSSSTRMWTLTCSASPATSSKPPCTLFMYAPARFAANATGASNELRTSMTPT